MWLASLGLGGASLEAYMTANSLAAQFTTIELDLAGAATRPMCVPLFLARRRGGAPHSMPLPRLLLLPAEVAAQIRADS